MSGKPMITSIQLSITIASILFKMLSDCVTSLKKVKSNTTVPYIELLIFVPAKPTSDEGTSCRLDLAGCDPTTVVGGLYPLHHSNDSAGLESVHHYGEVGHVPHLFPSLGVSHQLSISLASLPSTTMVEIWMLPEITRLTCMSCPMASFATEVILV